jgi:hypothetical protein
VEVDWVGISDKSLAPPAGKQHHERMLSDAAANFQREREGLSAAAQGVIAAGTDREAFFSCA